MVPPVTDRARAILPAAVPVTGQVPGWAAQVLGHRGPWREASAAACAEVMAS